MSVSSRQPHTRVPDRPARRTQDERRSRTRARLLDATMDCLADLGWAGTTTTEVARRAGVSRGAQQHHYPTRMALVAAALEHLLAAQRLAYEAAFTELPPERHNVEGALDLLWEVFRSRPARALLELAMAARTDEELRGLCLDLNERILATILATFERLFPRNPLHPEIVPTLLRSLFALYIGLSVQNALDDDAEGHHRDVLTQVKNFARLLVPGAAPDAAPLTDEPDAASDRTSARERLT
ncbi:TetR/AcrR family transcriptional regulator [Streptomyces sp. NBC_01803]|uniref:TetR/AcrR family transcriptional regulator n=1 Tax=Streptomyces sp. NBC_01803 TaxID=2975946 RepID=UPI002DDB2547|nr:TetR/AcrR family transcriptional regulator [Streptomyces sp. NBC_01803]WSA47383.1 TetR/AcrR family transcriptional regulator [Streptomyces sp. NBC_01803]